MVPQLSRLFAEDDEPDHHDDLWREEEAELGRPGQEVTVLPGVESLAPGTHLDPAALTLLALLGAAGDTLGAQVTGTGHQGLLPQETLQG